MSSSRNPTDVCSALIGSVGTPPLQIIASIPLGFLPSAFSFSCLTDSSSVRYRFVTVMPAVARIRSATTLVPEVDGPTLTTMGFLLGFFGSGFRSSSFDADEAIGTTKWT